MYVAPSPGMDGIDEDMVNEALNKMFTAKDLTTEGAAKLASSRIGGANHQNGTNQMNTTQSNTTSSTEVRTSTLYAMMRHVIRLIGLSQYRILRQNYFLTWLAA